MKRLISMLVIGIFLVYSYSVYAAEQVAAPNKIDGGGAGNWKKPELAETVQPAQVFEIVPPGIERRDGDIPGKGKHLGWEKGNHNGWEKQEAAEDNLNNAEEEEIENENDNGKKRTNWEINAQSGEKEKYGEVKNKGPIVSE